MLKFRQVKESILSVFASKRNFYVTLLAAMLVKNFPFGFRYFLFADDYNQYGSYALFQENLWQDLIVGRNLYGYRPLAGIVDVYIISRVWDNPEFVLLAMVLLHFATICLLGALFEKSNIIWGRAAAVFFALYPTLTESAYWISASSRIVSSAFLAVLAGYAILKFVYREGRYWLWFTAAMLSGLLAQGFYEQGIIFAFVLTLGVLLIHRKALIKQKLLFAWPFVNLAIIGTHYYIFRDVGLLGDRAQVAQYGLLQQIPTVAERIVTTFVREQAPTIANSLRWGIGQLFTEHLLLTIFAIIFSLLLALFIVFDKGKTPRDGEEPFKKGSNMAYSLLAASVLTFSTLSIFFFLAEPWIWVRNFFFLVIGLGIFVEILARCIRYSRHKGIDWGLRVTKGVAAALVAFVFFCGFVLEIDSLRLVEKYDTIIVSNLIDEVERLELDEEVETVWLFGARWNYARKINPRITSQVRLDWAVNGQYTVLSQGRRQQWIMPLMHGETIDGDFERDALLGLDEDLQVRELLFDGYYLIFANNGAVFGSINLEEGGRFAVK